MKSDFVRSISILAVLGLAPAVLGAPTFVNIPTQTLLSGSPLHIPIDGNEPLGGKVTYRVETSDPLVTATVLEGNRSLRLHVTGYGTMVFELFDQRVRRATNRIAELADSGFYNGIVFHRVINDFVIQAGDPTGTGTGGSGLPYFDDKFHLDLQHNRAGLLSMAKTADDTNDSQFFITEGPARHLDFQHSIFGILVEGELVRERISNVAVDADDKPLADVVIESAETFIDEQNGVVMLKAPEGSTGAVDVTIIARNESGQESQQTFRVDVTPDTSNGQPFLSDVPILRTAVDTPLLYQLEAQDAEGDPALYLDQNGMSANGLGVAVVADPNLIYVVDFETGQLSIGPTNGISGTYQLSVATAVSVLAVDYQVITVEISNDPVTKQ